MKPAYTSLIAATGAQASGICKIEIAPISWLDGKISVDFLTGSVIVPVPLGGKPMLLLDVAPNTGKHSEKPKTGKADGYFEIEVSGTINNITPVIIRSLRTFRYEKLLVIVTDPNKNMRIIGSHEDGMKLQSGYEQNSTGHPLSVSLTYTSQAESPFYIPA